MSAIQPYCVHDEMLHPRRTVLIRPRRFALIRQLEYNSRKTRLADMQLMKTLFLVRHAKSSWEAPALPDKERPLNERGKRDAPAMGRRLAMREVKADLILSSPARRALATAKFIAKGIDYKRGNIVIDHCLYPGAAATLLKIIHRLDKRVDRVMMVGHDPALTELARLLSKSITHMPTCAVAEFTFETKSWPKADKSTLATVRLERPKKS
jgi:phosphohistidine phosphatase